MRYTIALPCYNPDPSGLERAVRSALAQDLDQAIAPWEVVLLDNHSSPPLSHLLPPQLSGQVRVVRHETTVGMWGNHNRCLEAARGEYVLFCHGDDALYPNALRLYHQRLSARGQPQKVVLWGRSKFRDFYFHWTRGFGHLDQPLCGEFAFFPFLCAGLTPSGTLYSRQSMRECGGFFESPQGLCTSDMVSMVRLALEGHAVEMCSFMALDRTAASTLSGADRAEGEVWERRGWRAFEQVYGSAGVRRLGLMALEHLRAAEMTSLERFLLAQGRWRKEELVRLLMRRTSLSTVRHGEFLTLCKHLISPARTP